MAILTVVFPPTFIAQPTNQTVLAGGNVSFNAIISGGLPLVYQWRKNGTNLANGGNVSGATSNVLTLAAVVASNAGTYLLAVTNIYGAVTSSVATLAVVLPPSVTISPTNQTIQCGSNAAFSVAATGTAPLSCQWSLDNAAIAGATNTSLSLTNVHFPNHTVAVVVTNFYGSATGSVTLAVQDTLPPVITLNSTNPFYVELGSAFVDPGATATDLCAGSVPVIASGAVNVNVVGTNFVTYTATDGNGNTNSATRTVIVRDTTPPTILWSFTNLTLAAGTNCAAPMPNVTGTNFILATDLSGALTITQAPTNNAVLSPGTNLVIITVKDASGNAAFSTNVIVVRDLTPPAVLWSFTNLVLSANSNCTAMMPNVTGTNFILATDSCSPPLTISQTPTNNAVLPLGTYPVVVAVADSSGNTAFVTNTVVVADLTPPVITFLGDNPLTNEYNVAFVDPGATAADSCSGVATFTTNGIVNISAPGSYTLSYVATDAAGNAATNLRTVVVADTIPPAVALAVPEQTLTAGTNCTALLPNFTGLLTVTDNYSTTIHITQLPAPGSAVVPGNQFVTFLLDDGNGNTNASGTAGDRIGAVAVDRVAAAKPDQPRRNKRQLFNRRRRLFGLGLSMVFQHHAGCRPDKQHVHAGRNAFRATREIIKSSAPAPPVPSLARWWCWR